MAASIIFFLWFHNCIFSLYISFHAVNTSVLLFINFVNPPLEFGSYKRAVYAQVSVAFRFPFTYLSLRLGIHKFLLFRYNSFFRKLLQICPYLSQAHTLCPLALQYAELSPKSEAFLQFRHLTYTISGLTFFGILMVTSAFFWLPHLQIQPGVSTLDIQHKRFCYFHALLFLFHVGFCIVHAHADQCQSYVP